MSDHKIPCFPSEYTQITNDVTIQDECLASQKHSQAELTGDCTDQQSQKISDKINEISCELRNPSSSDLGCLKCSQALPIISQLQESVLRKDDEITKLKLDMESLNLKLLLQIEKGDELQVQRDATSSEIEDLTLTLFEEANTLVAKEARQRHGAQERVQYLERRLVESMGLLKAETRAAGLLRIRVNEVEDEIEILNALIANTLNTSATKTIMGATNFNTNPNVSTNLNTNVGTNLNTNVGTNLNTNVGTNLNTNVGTNLNPYLNTRSIFGIIDEILLNHFKAFVDQAPDSTSTQLQNLIFMRNALQDDIKPCLRFGGDPLESSADLLEAIVSNTCRIEEMSIAQIQVLIRRDATLGIIANAIVGSASTPNLSSTINLGIGLRSNSDDVISDVIRAGGIEEMNIVSPSKTKSVFQRLTTALIPQPRPQKPGCTKCGRQESYKSKLIISDITSESSTPICGSCRSRVQAVIEFYRFVRKVRSGVRGLFNALFEEQYEIKRRMFFCRVGCAEDGDDSSRVASFPTPTS